MSDPALHPVISDAPEPDPLPVLMGRVLADVPAVGKNSQAPSNMGGYAFRGIEDVLAALKPAMARHGVFCIPDVIERLPTERTLQGGKVMFVVDLCIRWTFYGPAGDTLTSTCWGQGTDMGDKSTQKAMTSAFKSMLCQTFCIGDAATDAEAHDVPDTQKGPTDPSQWFKSVGWKDEAEHDLRRAEARGDAAALHPEARSKIKEWMKSASLTFEAAWTRPEVDELIARTKALATEAPAPHQDDEKAASAPEPTDTPEAPSLPLPAPEKPEPIKGEWPEPEDDETARKSAIVAHVNAMTPAVLTDYLELRALDIEGSPKARKERLAKALVVEGWSNF